MPKVGSSCSDQNRGGREGCSRFSLPCVPTLPPSRVFEHSDILECNPQSKSKIGRSFGLHSGVFTPIRSAIQISIQNRPEFWIAPLHGVPIQIPCLKGPAARASASSVYEYAT